MKQNKIIPKFRFPEFENEEGWKEKKIGELGEIITGSTPLTSNRDFYDGGSYMFVSPFDINKNRYIDKTNNTLTKLGFLKGRLVRKNSTLFVCIGSTIGKVGQAKNDCVTNQQINAIVPYNEYDDDFLFSLLEYHSSPISILAGIQAVPIINKTTFSNYLLTVPSLHEQVKIGNCFSSLDEVIAQHEEKLLNLEEHKRGLMQNLFPQEGETKPKYRFPEFENEGDWEEKKIGEIGEPLMCKRIFKEETTEEKNGNIPFYKIGTFGRIADSYITPELFEDYKEKYSYPKVGEILISASGTIGRLVVFDGEPSYFQDSNIVWVRHNEKQVLNSFLFYSYTTLTWQTSDGGVIKRLYNSDLKNMDIVFPTNRVEQQKIADCLSSVDNLISETSERIKELKQHKQGLMQDLFPHIKG